MRSICLTAVLLCLPPALLCAADAQDSPAGLSPEEAAEGFVPIFDGKSLDGWVGLDGTTDSYYVKDGLLVDVDLDNVQPLDGQDHPGLKYEKGHISLHAHGNYGAEVFFRNLRVKEL